MVEITLEASALLKIQVHSHYCAAQMQSGDGGPVMPVAHVEEAAGDKCRASWNTP